MTLADGATCAGGLASALWLYLLVAHGRFWWADQRFDGEPTGPEPAVWPPVAAIVPARDEAECLPETLPTLLDQDYPGPFRIVLVDDESRDGTATRAAALAAAHPEGERLAICATDARPRPPGWTGKLWAQHCGVAAAGGPTVGSDSEPTAAPDARPAYFLLTDADIAHPPDLLRRLVGRAEGDGRDAVSLMVRLAIAGFWERLLVPAFVYFFQQLYPFPRVNDPRCRTAAAAGGCILVRAAALRRAGGFAAIRSEIIDDCALAARLKPGASIWLGLSDTSRSVRRYGGLSGVWAVVARTAYAQLRNSTTRLAAAVTAMILLHGVPPALVFTAPLHRSAVALAAGALAWLTAALSFLPTLRHYHRSPLWALALPAAGLLYTAMTVDSARRQRRGVGGFWKGRPAGGRGGAESGVA